MIAYTGTNLCSLCQWFPCFPFPPRVPACSVSKMMFTFSGACNWSPQGLPDDHFPWIQANFNHNTIFNSVTTQGRNEIADDRRTTNYTLAVSDDDITFHDIVDENGTKIYFAGNTDNTSKVTQLLPKCTNGYFLRLYVTDWN